MSLRVEFRIYKKQIKQENLLFQELVYENDVALVSGVFALFFWQRAANFIAGSNAFIRPCNKNCGGGLFGAQDKQCSEIDNRKKGIFFAFGIESLFFLVIYAVVLPGQYAVLTAHVNKGYCAVSDDG